jgi:hypothetical protein
MRGLSDGALERIAEELGSADGIVRDSKEPELMDLSSESTGKLERYGVTPGKPSFAAICLLARRLIERGVRYVQLFHEAWDQHLRLKGDTEKNCRDTDRATAALIKDLKQRGLLDETMVMWGGEGSLAARRWFRETGRRPGSSRECVHDVGRWWELQTWNHLRPNR